MTTPRVTEIPPTMAVVERDPFGDMPASRRNVHEPPGLERRAKLVREVIRGEHAGSAIRLRAIRYERVLGDNCEGKSGQLRATQIA